MGLEFLARVRKTTAWAAPVVALMVATYLVPARGLDVLLGAAWSLANLWLLEVLIVAITGPDRGRAPTLKRAGFSIGGMLGLVVLGALLLTSCHPVGLLGGFLIPFAVLVLKAASLILLGSRTWSRFASDPRRVTGWLVAIALALWAASPLMAVATDSPPPAADHAVATAAEHDSSAHGTAAHGEGHGESSGPQKFANVITVLSRAFPTAGWAQFLHHYEAVIFSMVIAVILCVIAWAARRNAKMIPGPLQNVVELLVEKLYDFIVGILGEKHGKRFVPFLGTLFVYIWFMNLFGLIPFMDSPTSNLNVTFALAITVFFYVQYVGLRSLGVVGYVDHLLGSPRDLTGWLLAPLMLPIHVLGELAKPISLASRLFGNVFGEDMLLVAFVSLGVTTLAFTGLPVGLPLHLPFLGLALLTGTLQALVFTVLSTIYLLLMLPHDEHHAEEGHHAH
jgi:F-type H+-transporting ATPase subunit a